MNNALIGKLPNFRKCECEVDMPHWSTSQQQVSQVNSMTGVHWTTTSQRVHHVLPNLLGKNTNVDVR